MIQPKTSSNKHLPFSNQTWLGGKSPETNPVRRFSQLCLMTPEGNDIVSHIVGHKFPFRSSLYNIKSKQLNPCCKKKLTNLSPWVLVGSVLFPTDKWTKKRTSPRLHLLSGMRKPIPAMLFGRVIAEV